MSGPGAARPLVSLIMVVHGSLDAAVASLAAVAASSTDVEHDVTVVDNASDDRTARALLATGCRVVRSDVNLGYGGGVNLGAMHSTGEYLGALNSDIAPEPGWLASLVSAISRDESAAVSVPLYRDSDGRVQEAGVVIGCDGRGYGYGDRLGVGAPEVSFGRRVDYGSAAALVCRRDAFERVGGFDPVFGLGYYEDADLCFRLRQAGWATRYSPQAVVTHDGGGSFPSAARLALIRRNRPIFVARHRDQLRGRPRLQRPPWDPHRDLVVRDWWAPSRALLIGDSDEMAALSTSLVQYRPASLVTLVRSTGSRPVDTDVEDCTVHRDRVASWVGRRRNHYSAVVLDAPPSRRVARCLDRHQAPARLISLGFDKAGFRRLDQATDVAAAAAELGL